MKAALAKGSIVGGWQLERELGQGGQAVVWRVRHTTEHHTPPGAMKIAKSQDEKGRSRFQREAEILAGQSHPGIVKIRELGEQEGVPYFVMELGSTTLSKVSAGETAGARVLLESRDLLIRLLRQVCEATAYLHTHDILHRDLKPSNVLLMLDPPESLRAVLADFGIASVEANQGELTAPHEVVGTPAFRAPEALLGRHTKQSDVYSLGKTIESVLNRTEVVPVGPGRCLRDQRLTEDLWDAMDRLLARACAYDPSERFEDAGEMLRNFPSTVLGIDAPNVPEVRNQRASTISLSWSERVVLYDLLSRCPSADDVVPVHRVMTESRLKDYHFSMALRRLEELEFVQGVRELDYNGDGFAATRPTPAGVAWAQEHEEQMSEVAPKSAPDEDIPF